MFLQSFTGNARPRRQVNLSGRNTNPFAVVSGSRQPHPPHPSQNAVVHAQQERQLRQQERERPPAATRIQRTWRGHRSREETRDRWRREWDECEAVDNRESVASMSVVSLNTWPSSGLQPYGSERACLSQLRLLIQFANPKLQGDILRLHLFVARYLSSIRSFDPSPENQWIFPLLRLVKITIATLEKARAVSLPSSVINEFLSLLATLTSVIPKEISSYSPSYYKALAEVSACTGAQALHQFFDSKLLENAVLGLLQPITGRTITAYKGFISEFLVTPNLWALDGGLHRIAAGINYKLMAGAITEVFKSSLEYDLLRLKTHDELLWLLAYIIYCRRVVHGHRNASPKDLDARYVKVISDLISHLAEDIARRIDVPADSRSKAAITSVASQSPAVPLPSFVREQILTLVDQESVSSLLAHLEVNPSSMDGTSSASSQASTLASYALTLLTCFPRRADEIRMWLYLGSTSRHSRDADRPEEEIPAIKYFYQAARRTEVYRLIRGDPHETIDLLRSDAAKKQSKKTISQGLPESTAQQWRVILLFLELYTFILKVMDDEEFLSGSSPSNNTQSWTRQSALPLDQVQDLTLFLKNLAFAMYWNASAISGIESSETKTTIAEWFGSNNISAASEVHQDGPSSKPDVTSVAGVSGITIRYMKGMITGLLRMVYEREYV